MFFTVRCKTDSKTLPILKLLLHGSAFSATVWYGYWSRPSPVEVLRKARDFDSIGGTSWAGFFVYEIFWRRLELAEVLTVIAVLRHWPAVPLAGTNDLWSVADDCRNLYSVAIRPYWSLWLLFKRVFLKTKICLPLDMMLYWLSCKRLEWTTFYCDAQARPERHELPGFFPRCWYLFITLIWRRGALQMISSYS